MLAERDEQGGDAESEAHPIARRAAAAEEVHLLGSDHGNGERRAHRHGCSQRGPGPERGEKLLHHTVLARHAPPFEGDRSRLEGHRHRHDREAGGQQHEVEGEEVEAGGQGTNDLAFEGNEDEVLRTDGRRPGTRLVALGDRARSHPLTPVP